MGKNEWKSWCSLQGKFLWIFLYFFTARELIRGKRLSLDHVSVYSHTHTRISFQDMRGTTSNNNNIIKEKKFFPTYRARHKKKRWKNGKKDAEKGKILRKMWRKWKKNEKKKNVKRNSVKGWCKQVGNKTVVHRWDSVQSFLTVSCDNNKTVFKKINSSH
jgi:hypothetical protein